MKKEFLTTMFLALSMLFVLSCGDDDDNELNGGNETSTTENTSNKYEELLKKTSWKQIEGYYLNDDGTKRYENNRSGVITFADNHVFYLIGYQLGTSIYTASGTWKGTETGVDIKMNGDSQESWATYQGIVVAAGYSPGYIMSITDSKMRCKPTENSKYYYEFSKVSYQEPGNNNGGGSSSDDKPYVTSFDFTATKTSITVKFMCSERPTSATVKYGTSSPSSTASSSISGKQVSATVNGLKSGTKYYFKCTVSNSYGSSTSDTFTAITNY